MLRKLTVRNFALIRNADLDFKSGYSVITGETGSGKSILLGALKLILGERADYSVIRDQSAKTIVEATFDLKGLHVINFFQENDLDFSEEVMIRREINAQGKSRAFVNDTPVQLNVLKLLTERLIHIHSQHHTIDLKNREFQLFLLDALVDATALREACQRAFFDLKLSQRELQTLEDRIALSRREYDFHLFQLDELKQLRLDVLDFEGIEEEVNRGAKAEDIARNYSAVSDAIQGESGVSSSLSRLIKLNSYNDLKFMELIDRIQQVKVELDDIADTAAGLMDSIAVSPEEMQVKTELFNQYNGLLMKHNCVNQDMLLKMQHALEEKVEHVESGDEQIQALNEKVRGCEEEFFTLAHELGARRRSGAEPVAQEIVTLLHRLKLDAALFSFSIEKAALGPFGLDEVKMLFSANKGMEPLPMEKVASGGELSRLMLVIQYLLSGKKKLPTVIFDEIDTGVSGEVAQRIGELLQLMGNSMQLVAITHLPQVAAKGGHHYQVSKTEDDKNETITHILELKGEDKIIEIARLMSGSEVNQAAIENAKNLMN